MRNQIKKTKNKKQNAWEIYYKQRKDYFGKHGNNSDEIIYLLNIKKSDIVLDIGCGLGAYLTDINNKTKAKCFGLDISKTAISKNKNKKINLQLGDMRKMPFSNNQFSKIFSLGTIEHVPETNKVIKEISRTTKNKAEVLLTVPNKLSFFHITKKIKQFLGIWPEDIGYEKSFYPRQLINLLKKQGFNKFQFFIKAHPKVSNIFNLLDNFLNLINNKKFGFFIYLIAKK